MTEAFASAEAFAYCADMVRTADPDRFSTVAFAPPPARPALLALYAFNVEVAKTREVVSQPMLGSIRLQWWRESLDGIYEGSPRRHQVVLALAEAVGAHRLPRADFDTLLDAREADMADDPPADLEALLRYAEGTAGSLSRLALRSLGAEDAASQEAGTKVGTAWALTGLLRAMPFHARARRVYLPADLLRAGRLSAGAVAEAGLSADRAAAPALTEVVRTVAGAAEAQLEAARQLRWDLPRRALPGLITGVLVSAHLTRLRQVGWNPFDPRLAEPLASRGWRLLAARLTGSY